MRRQTSQDFKDIFEKYRNKIYGLALSITANEKDAEDILQNTFIKIIKNLKYFQHRSSLSTWIYRIAHNEILMSLRKKRRQYNYAQNLKKSEKIFPAGLSINWFKLPDKELLDDEFKSRMGLAIRQLPIKYRMVVLLHNIGGFRLKEAAAILKIKENTLKARLHRAYSKLKDSITEYLEDRDIKHPQHTRGCGRLSGFLQSYAGGNLDKIKQKNFENTIKDCPACKSFLRSYAQSIRITKALECSDVPGELQARVLKLAR